VMNQDLALNSGLQDILWWSNRHRNTG
jgi:hypothetical protein